MAQILVRNLDEGVVKKLKERAKENGRSLQAEVTIILEREAEQPKLNLQALRKVADDICSRFNGREFTDSAELIREDRDR